MRIWDLDPSILCRKHLLSEHRELHGLWNILTVHKFKGGYSKHPETLRWVGKEKALFLRHESLVVEFKKRGYKHQTPLKSLGNQSGQEIQDKFILSIEEQILLLRSKSCDCNA